MGGKKSSCILLLAAFAALLRLGGAEGDALPPSLVDMVRDSPISSIDDLKKLLDTDSVEEEIDNQTTNEIYSSDGHHRVPRSLMASAEQAKQAACKVRTEVLEVTRSMHDRTNAHFMLWPPCVEVQRCSGCCSRTSQCVPVVTEIRQLQMTKITYVNMRAHFEKVIVPVEDHVRCGCQPLSTPQQRPPPSPPPPPASRLAPKPPLPHSPSKEDLQRHEQLKHTQRLHLEEPHPWQSKYSPAHTASEPHHMPVQRQASPQHTLTHTQVEERDTEETGAGEQLSFSDSSVRQQEDGRQPVFQHPGVLQTHQSPEHTQHQPNYPQPNYRLSLDSDTHRHPPTHSLPANHMLRDATTPHQPLYHHSQSDMASLPHGQSEGSSHHSASEGSGPEVSSGQKTAEDTEEEERRRRRTHKEELGRDSTQDVTSHLHQDSHHGYHHKKPQPHHQPQTSTQRAVTDAPITQQPPSTSPRANTTPHPPPPRRRRRKHRRRISKATMRAMIMVMS